jgi:hypothetical protein
MPGSPPIDPHPVNKKAAAELSAAAFSYRLGSFAAVQSRALIEIGAGASIPPMPPVAP